LTVGKPYREPTVINLAPSALDNYIGVYQLNEKEEAIVRREGEKLFVSFPDAGKTEINPSSETEFFIKDSRSRLNFTRNAAGLVTGFVLTGSSGPDQEATKTSKPLPAERQAIVLDRAVYDGYVGEYEIAPSFSIAITKEGSKLMAQATGQPKLEIFPESRTKFFVKEVAVQIEFVVDGVGKATSLVLYQGGRQLPAKKIKQKTNERSWVKQQRARLIITRPNDQFIFGKTGTQGDRTATQVSIRDQLWLYYAAAHPDCKSLRQSRGLRLWRMCRRRGSFLQSRNS